MNDHLLAFLVGVLVLVVATTCGAKVVRAEHAVIDLKILTPEGQVDAISDQEPPFGGVNPRPRLEVTTDDALALQFVLTNVYPHGVIKDAKIRYFVVRTEKIGQKTIPPLTSKKDVVTEALTKETVVTQGEVVMNLKPKCRVGARVRFRISEPGIYLVRIDTLNTKSDHEHFSSIDLVVK